MIRRTLNHDEHAEWLEKANWRLAECEAELRRHQGAEKSARRHKLTARADRYRGMVAYLRNGAGAQGPDPVKTLTELEEELAAIKEQMVRSALALIHARDNWKKLRTRWGRTADELMAQREAASGDPGRVPSIDFRFPPPPASAPPERREAHEILRSLGL
jgi:hypothetical protein